ncbi:MAG: hypothetical protein KBT04_06610 [Bacteroidales bacterium]|nr:hypothetical protein [Candidatus Colimorpha onthohippi]
MNIFHWRQIRISAMLAPCRAWRNRTIRQPYKQRGAKPLANLDVLGSAMLAPCRAWRNRTIRQTCKQEEAQPNNSPTLQAERSETEPFADLASSVLSESIYALLLLPVA